MARRQPDSNPEHSGLRASIRMQTYQYVVDHIKNLIDKYGNLISESSTEEVTAGNVKHLNKDFRFKINEGILPFIRALHPTPAIAGTPTKKAIDFISKHEIHDRNLYCGYLGLISTEKAEIYVNLSKMNW